MRNRSAVIMLAAFAACSAQVASAEDSGAYIGVGLAGGFLSACANNGTDTCNSFTSDPQESTHLRLIGGYDFNKIVGVEAGYSYLGAYKVKNTSLQTAGTVKASAVTLAAKAGYKFPVGFSVFGKLGLASVNTQYTADPGWVLTMTANQHSPGVIAGAGGQYDFNELVGIRITTDVIAFKDAGYNGGFVATSVLAVFKF